MEKWLFLFSLQTLILSCHLVANLGYTGASTLIWGQVLGIMSINAFPVWKQYCKVIIPTVCIHALGIENCIPFLIFFFLFKKQDSFSKLYFLKDIINVSVLFTIIPRTCSYRKLLDGLICFSCLGFVIFLVHDFTELKVYGKY